MPRKQKEITMKKFNVYLVFALAFTLSGYMVVAHNGTEADHQHSNGQVLVQSTSGDNPWNQGKEHKDWWQAIKTSHGHVGPWNVMGWPMGKTALRQFQVD